MERYFQQAILSAELNQVQVEQAQLHGAVVLPRPDASSLVWEGVVFVTDGPFAPGPFKFRLILPDDFPHAHAPPVVRFQSGVFHPCIDPTTNELNLGARFKTWSSPWQSSAEQPYGVDAWGAEAGAGNADETGDAAAAEGVAHNVSKTAGDIDEVTDDVGDAGSLLKGSKDWLWHVLVQVKHIFEPSALAALDQTSIANHDAASLLKSDSGLFALKAAESVRASGADLYATEHEDFAIRFSRWEKGVHSPALQSVLADQYQLEELENVGTNTGAVGLSWAASGLPFARSSD